MGTARLLSSETRRSGVSLPRVDISQATIASNTVANDADGQDHHGAVTNAVNAGDAANTPNVSHGAGVDADANDPNAETNAAIPNEETNATIQNAEVNADAPAAVPMRSNSAPAVLEKRVTRSTTRKGP